MSYLEDVIETNAPASILSNPDYVRSWAMENLHGKTLNQITKEIETTPYFGLNSSNYYHYASDYIQNKRREEARNLTMGEQVAITDMMRQLANAPTMGYSLDENGRATPRNWRSEIAGQMNQTHWWRNMSSNALYSMASLPSRAVGLLNPELGTELDNYYQTYYNPQQAPGGTTGQVIGNAWNAALTLVAPEIGITAYGAAGAGDARMIARDQRLLGHDISGLEELEAATLKGGVEVLSSLLTRGLAKVGGKAIYPVLGKIAPKLSSTLMKSGPKVASKSFIKAIGAYLGTSLGEGAEEAVTEVFHNFVDSSILEVKKDLDEGAGEAFKLGVVTNLVLGLLHAGVTSNVQAKFNLAEETNPEKVPMADQWEVEDDPIEPTEGIVKATYKQQDTVHKMAEKLELKKDEFNAIKEKMTGKRSMANMTVGEAQNLIDTMSEIADLKFKQPTIGKHFTAQLYEAERLGLGGIIKPLADQEVKRIGKVRGTFEHVDQLTNELNQAHGISKSKARKIHKRGDVTEAESYMAKMLDTHEEAPAGMPENQKKVFNELRALTRDIITRKNESRAKLGLEPIPIKSGYIPHIVKETTDKIMNGELENIPQEILYWMKKKASKEIYDEREFRRQLEEKVGEKFSTDLPMLVKSMVWSGENDIYMRKPLDQFKTQMELLKHVIPASTRQWAEDYVKHNIRHQTTNTDEFVDNIVNATGMRGLINKVIRPFGKQVISKTPMTDFFRTLGKLNIYGTMAFRPKLWIRNTFQRLQLMALYGVRNTIKGSVYNNDSLLQELMDKSTFLEGYTGVENLSRQNGGVMRRFGLGVYQWTAVANARAAMRSAYYAVKPLFTNPKYMEDWADPRRNGTEPKEFLYDSEKQKLLKEMEFGAAATQYQYIGLAMPEIFRHKSLRPVTQLQSWWMNYFFQFNREALIRTFTGKTGYGQKIPGSWRANYAKYLLLGGGILQELGYGASFMAGAAPARFAPTATTMLALYGLAIASNDRDEKKSWNQLVYSLQAFIPGGLAIKEIKDLLSGKKDIADYFFYKKKEKK